MLTNLFSALLLYYIFFLTVTLPTCLPVLGTNKVGKSLWLFWGSMMVCDIISIRLFHQSADIYIHTVIMAVVSVVGRPQIFHLQDIAAFRTAFNWAFTRHLTAKLSTVNVPCVRQLWAYRKPDDDMRVCWIACAASILLITKGLNNDWVIQRSCIQHCKPANTKANAKTH